MLMRKTLKASVLVMASLVLVSLADAARLYRYRNDDGNIVLDSRIPKQFVSKGYDILDDKGRVIKHIPRALNEAEIAEKNRLDALVLAAEEAQAQALERDKMLLRQYTVVEDVVRARDRKVQALEALVQTARASIARLLTEKQSQQGRAAKLERQDRKVPDNIVKAIAGIDKQIAQLTKKIGTRQQQQELTRAGYDNDISRLKELLGIVDDEEPALIDAN